MKKRIISLVLVGVLTLSILGGCGKKEIPLEESTTESTDELIAEEGAEILYEKAYNVTARKNIESINGLKDDDALKVYTEAFDDAVPMPQVKRISYYWTTMQSVLSAVFDGKITPEEGAKKAQDDFEALVASE